MAFRDGLEDRLAAFLRDHGEPSDTEVVDLTEITGGYSLLTMRFTARSSAGERPLVLRANRPADAAINQTDRAREWEVLQHLTRRGDVPMPVAHSADPTGERLGVPAIVLEFLDGPQLGTRIAAAQPDELGTLVDQLAVAAAHIHRVPVDSLPACLEHPDSWDDYIDEKIALWRQVEAEHCERDPFIRWIATWMDRHRPSPAPMTLVHGEFQAGNLMFDADDELNVIDWEWAEIGDPRADLGWYQTAAAFNPPDLIATHPERFCRRYCDETGLSEDVVNPATINYFGMLNAARTWGLTLGGMAAMARGENHLITTAYLTSAEVVIHDLWRQWMENIEAAEAEIERTMKEFA